MTDARPSASTAARNRPPAPGRPAVAEEPVGSWWAPTIVGIALIAAIGTFLFLLGSFGVEPDERGVLVLLGFDVVLILVLFGLVIRQLIRLRRANQAGRAGARLHRRVVGLFSLVAAVPTTLVAGAGIIALERGLTPWFSGDLRALVQNAELISRNFQQQI